MLTNYFKTAIRNLRHNKAFSFINVLGLSIGISAALVIFLIVQYDFSFDRFHTNRDRIYRVTSLFTFSGETYKNPGVAFPLGNTIGKEVTGLDIIAPIKTWNENQKITIPAQNGSSEIKLKKQPAPVFADENYFKLVPYEWVAGTGAVSLKEPYQVVLTEKTAGRYFPKLTLSEILGKEIIFDDTVRTTVTGIVKDLTVNTDLGYTTFVSRITLEKTSLQPRDWKSWGNTTDASQLLVQLSPGTSAAKVEKMANALLAKYNKKEKDDPSTQAFKLQPLADLHFNADLGNYSERTAHKPTLYGLLAVAAFLLVLGCINFINLTTAQASHRAKEIGIRKTMGGSRKQLLLQFMSETFVITLLATILSIVLTPFLLKIFSDFIPPQLHFDLFGQPLMMGFLVLLIICVTFLSGFYPAMVLSSFKPVNVLKNQNLFNTGNSRKNWIRKSLTVSQFTIAQFFILATLVVSSQIHFTLNKDLGFTKEALIFFRTNYRDTSRAKKLILAKELKSIPEVAAVGLSTGTPASPDAWSSTIGYHNGKKEITTDVEMKFGDTGYLRQFGMKLLAGKNYSASDTAREFLINQTYAKTLGFSQPAEAVGVYLTWDNKKMLVTGVLADFHQKSLHQQIKPLALGSWDLINNVFAVTLPPKNADGSNWKTAITKIEKAWKQIYPEEDFDYHFLDESIAQSYRAEQHIASLLKWATGLAVLISCLGLLGLVMFTTNQRTKEIGIRKVLGASVTQIVTILSKDFLWLVLVAFVIATPVAWYALNQWLQNFAYRTPINLWLFLLAGMAMFFVALLTISLQTFKAASTNPADSLRTE